MTRRRFDEDPDQTCGPIHADHPKVAMRIVTATGSVYYDAVSGEVVAAFGYVEAFQASEPDRCVIYRTVGGVRYPIEPAPLVAHEGGQRLVDIERAENRLVEVVDQAGYRVMSTHDHRD